MFPVMKTEQWRGSDQVKRVVPSATTVPLTLRPQMIHPTQTSMAQLIDPHAIDISSIKGRFAWEKIVLGDTYMPVIFRGTTKYFCVKMLHKLLPEYPDDVIRRSSLYQYRKPIDLYIATPNELRLINRINVHHSHWAYSRQAFTTNDDLVRVSDFLPFYEHLRLVHKPMHIPRTAPVSSSRQIIPHSSQTIERSHDFPMNMSNTALERSTEPPKTTLTQVGSCSTSDIFRKNPISLPQPTIPIPCAPRRVRQPKTSVRSLTLSQPSVQYPSTQLQQQLSSPPIQQPIATSSSSVINFANTVLSNKHLTTPVSASTSQSPPISKTSIQAASSSSPDPISSRSPVLSYRKRSTTASEIQLTPISKQLSSSLTTTPSPSVPVPSRVNCGWLQINKLYTPYVSADTSNHHLYKIPVSLLTFYDLLKTPSGDNNASESKDVSFSMEQTLVTLQEIELINELCLKQNIKPFSIDTKLINLLTFYKYCSANILFVKELPMNEPKASICKDWSSVVQINGGICRLRNIATLHEQTVPFIGNNLLKSFIMSSQCLASASLTTPTTSEFEFLQLILFFSNMSIDIRNVKLIDIESVQKEYNVDLILLFNDKFPLNILNYQHQDNQPSTSQGQVIQSDSSAATNTFAESTPPPSPPSSPTNNISINSTSQLPLTSSTASSSNRYQRTIIFHGHSMAAYICSGLGSDAQRECLSVNALCNMLYPNSSIIDKLESKMLRLLRIKNINRFRPQNQQSMGFTRLIDVKDVENHWNYIEQGMRSLTHHHDGETIILREVTSSLLDRDLKASTLDKIENNSEKNEQVTSIEVNKCDKRSLEKELEEEDMPILARIDKRTRLSEEDPIEQPKLVQSQSLAKTINNKFDHRDGDKTEEDVDDDDDKNQRIVRAPIRIVPRRNDKKNIKNRIQPQTDRLSNRSSVSLQKPSVAIKKKIKTIRKRSAPCVRSTKQSMAAWVQKYNIEECCVRLDLYIPIRKTEKN